MEGKGSLYMKAQHKQVLLSDVGRTELLLLIERGLLGYGETSEVLHNTTHLVRAIHLDGVQVCVKF